MPPSGYNPAEITTFQAELAVTSRTSLPASSVEKQVEAVVNDVETVWRAAGASESEIQKRKKEFGESLRRSLLGEARSRLIRVFIENSAAPVALKDTPPKILEVGIGDDIGNKGSALFSSILGAPAEAAKERATISQTEKTTVISAGGGSSWYCTAGRIAPLSAVIESLHLLLSRDDSGVFAISETGIAAFKKFCEDNDRTFTLSKERVKYEEEYSAYILQVFEKGKLQARFLIDPDRGYICPKAQIFDADTGDVSEEVVSENFMLDKNSQKWFPEKTVYSYWTGVTDGKKLMSSREFRVMPGTLILNQPIPDSVFSLTVREGTRVDDVRRDDTDTITFIADHDGRLDLPTVEQKSLDEIPWLTPREVVQYCPPPIKKASFSRLQIL